MAKTVTEKRFWEWAETRETYGVDGRADEVALAALRHWVVSETASSALTRPDAVRAYEQMGTILVHRLCDRFTTIAEVRSFARRLLRAVETDVRHGADPVVAEALKLFWRNVVAFLDDRGWT